MIVRKFNNSSSDIDFLFNLRNKKYVKKVSFNEKKIKKKSHLEWLKKNLKNNKIEIFIFGKNNKINYGYVAKKKKNNKIYLSWAILKQYNSKNYTTLALKKTTNKKKYCAHIKINNIASQIVALKAGFSFYKKFGTYIEFKKD
tara:strand:+ start:18604 stop:19032 length:429 start_codon:yes stop_codon:yes gene_type:complete